jgi:HlyD family secretion protein
MLSQAEAQQGRLDDGEAWADIASAQAALANAVAAEKQAYNLHERTMDCFTIKVPGVGERKICPALGKIEEQARFSWHTAGDQLAAAQAQLGAVQNLAVARTRDASAAVESAAAQRDATQALLDLQKAGNQSERIAAAEAEVAGAEASLARAQAALEDTNIRAPFAGTMAQVNVEVGDTAVPGMVLLVLATLDELQVRTIDLTEIDVVRAAQGHPVVVTLEALPDTTLNGRVARIDPQSSDYRGDVTYPVIIELDEDAPGLRWGMTAMVEIEVD